MSKCILLGDTHFGTRNDSLSHLEYMMRFYDEVFFPRLKKDKITKVFQLGDLMDRRKFVNFNILHQMKKLFLDRLLHEGIEMTVIVGNHDLYFKEVMKINSISELFYGYENVTVIDKPTTVRIDKSQVDIIPWICEENKAEIFQFMGKSKSEYLLAHLEMIGFDMFKGMKSEHGLEKEVFARYKQVYTGHYHTHSSNGNIEYLGTPYELTWADCGDQKGFGLWEPSKNEMEFIPNPFKLFHKLNYDDSIINYDKMNLDQFKSSYIKIIIAKKEDEKMFERFVDRIYSEACPNDISIIDTSASYQDVEIDSIETQDPLSILIASVDDQMKDAKDVRRLIQDIHAECMTAGASM